MLLNFLLSNDFWTALTAVGTIAMAFVTLLSLRQNDKLLDENRKQLEEMKRQWKEENEPKLDVHLVDSPNIYELGSISIQIYNYGNSLADNVKLSFENDFVRNIPIKSLQQYLRDLQKKTYRILPHTSIIIPFCNYSDNRKDSGYLLYGQKISLNDKYSLDDLFKNNFMLRVYYDKTESIELSLSSSELATRNTSIQDELSYIQVQLALLRSELKFKKNNE
jgi:hypothetical protein